MPPEYILAAFAIDMVIGDPRSVPHPVQGIGLMVSAFEKVFRPAFKGTIAERVAGAVMAVIVVSATYVAAALVIDIFGRVLGHWGAAAAAVYLAYTTLSTKSLADAARSVMKPLAEGDVESARIALSMIVGRDTAGLSGQDVARGAVETVAENASDGVVAPLFYLALGGAPLALAYKAVNTMDSMVGYRSEEYRYFGEAAARLDDLANFVPARLTGLIMAGAAGVLSAVYPGRYSFSASWQVLSRDRLNHASPNSGHPEAAMAGALGVRLGGESSYFGVRSVKPYIGEPLEPLGHEKISDAVRLMLATSSLALMFSMLAAWFAGRLL